jgi:serine/threonine-protein kinase
VRLFLPVCDAVQLAHRNLVVHRDLKPANLLVNAEGRPKLLDFGIARLLEPGDTERTQTSLAMTPAYAAPEQQRGGEITTATDVFQLGRVLQELLTERGPEIDLARGSAHSAIDDARRTTVTPRGDLGRILAKAQAELPADRYASVAMFADDLGDWLAARPLRSGIGSARAQTRYLLTRFRWPLGLAVAVLVTLSLGAVVALQQAQRAQLQTRAAQAHLQSLLDVLGSANPGRYAGREATAGEFLLGAATALQQRADDQPELVRRASVEIAHALINLGRGGDAEPLLQTALLAAERDPGASLDARLVILGLLMHAQDSPAAASRAWVSAAQIEALVGEGTVATGNAVDALARAGGVLSKQGEFALSRRLFARAAVLIGASAKAAPKGVVENYWRQRGWAALRAADADTAQAALVKSLAVIAADPTGFSPLRRAEGEVLLAEAELANGEREAAQQRFEAALPVLLEEYGGEHPERAATWVKRAAHALGGADLAGPRDWLALAEPVLLRHASDYARDLAYIPMLRARLAAQQRDCTAARQELALAAQRVEDLPQRLPREQAALSTAAQAVAGACDA